MHPMDFSDHICKTFGDSNIIKFKRIGKKLVSITFKSCEAANHFMNGKANLLKGWVFYIPNYKVFRTAVVRGVNPNYSTQKIFEGISWSGEPINVAKIERLKFKDRDSNNLIVSSSIKLTLETDLYSPRIFIFISGTETFTFYQQSPKMQQLCKMGAFSSVLQGKLGMQ